MTKSELLKFLEPFTDDVEIFMYLGTDRANLTVVKPVTHIIDVQPSSTVAEPKEIWLSFEEIK